ncbi:MAG: response regulator [Nitrososphaerales archaeon]
MSKNATTLHSVQPDFSILWVDNHPTAVKKYQRSISEWYRTKYGREVSIEDAVDVREALTKQSKSYFDLIVTDWDLGRPPDGSTLVERLRTSAIYTDVVFYTRKPEIPAPITERVQKLGFIDVVLEDQLTKITVAVIQERLKRFEKVSFLRGMVISRFIELEEEVNQFLLTYYKLHPEREAYFKSSLLENDSVSFWAKVNALKMITFGKQGFEAKDTIFKPFTSIEFATMRDGFQRLRNAENVRNRLAHCALVPGEEKLQAVSMGVLYTFERNDVVEGLKQIVAASIFITQLSKCL